MKRASAVLAILSVSVAAAGCSRNNSKPGVVVEPPHPQEQAGPAWTLSYETNCAGASESCAGAAGISITSEGKYELADGSRSGRVLPEDLKELNAKLNDTISTASTTELCSPLENEKDKTMIKLTRKEQGVKTLLHTELGQYCHLLADEETAHSLQKAIAALAERYYFPNPCVDSELALSDAYDSVRSCSEDTDCSYVGGDFSALDSSGGGYVQAENCGSVKTLAAANAKLLASTQPKLQEALGAAEGQCRGDFVRDPLCHLDGFPVEISKPAICQDHVCRANPATGY